MSLRNALRYSVFKKTFSIDVMRHAESVGNIKPKIIQGSSTDLRFSLTECGKNSVKSELKNIPKPDLLIYSPLLRCTQTAEEWFGCDFKDIPTWKISDPNLKEINAGDYHGRTIDATLAQDVLWKSWLTNPLTFKGFPNGETPFQFQRRVLNAFSNICSKYSDTSLHVCVLTHGIVMRVLKCHLNNKDLSHLWTYDVENLERLTLTKEHIHLLTAKQSPDNSLRLL